jgi:mRNA-degrading endonuclease RelE of RelBE toxin-antitoxin system
MTSKPPYSIRLHKRARKGLSKLSPAHREKARQFINVHLRFTPLRPVPGKTKRLAGPLAGVYQYDLSRSDRIWWRVDEEEYTVYVLYMGPHPKATD